MSLPSITVTQDQSGAWAQPPGARAWWVGPLNEPIRNATIDVDDAATQVRHALTLAPADGLSRRHLRDAQTALHVARSHLERARRQYPSSMEY